MANGKCVFGTDLARNIEVVVTSMNEGNGNGDGKGSSSGEDSDESDEEAVQEPEERAAEESAKEALEDQDQSHQNKHFLIYVYFSYGCCFYFAAFNERSHYDSLLKKLKHYERILSYCHYYYIHKKLITYIISIDRA